MYIMREFETLNLHKKVGRLKKTFVGWSQYYNPAV